MEPLVAASALFMKIPQGMHPQWKVRLLVSGSGFRATTRGLSAAVGGQPVEGITLGTEGAGFAGFLRAEPAKGDRLSVGYGRRLGETGVTYQGPLHDPIELGDEGPVA
ncbi:hypothetical protein SAMN05444920_107357 [Nonomuraea solani]|uniref:Uncharacterized protein n=1 Tax=Nonomuraea solani TaxID=1144553 RepID=A0A1H6E3B1_9ACTN|nr:hypothetical protein [Nonomuraea solani]SEG91809.1 hypothetical protein SAMN05444920_107357 [Nonomuraea solani]